MNAIQASPPSPPPKADRVPARPADERPGDTGTGFPERDAFAALLRIVSGETAPTTADPVAPVPPAETDPRPARPAPATEAETDLAALLVAIANPALGAPPQAPVSEAAASQLPIAAAPVSDAIAAAKPPRPGADVTLPGGAIPETGEPAVPAAAVRVIAQETHFAPLATPSQPSASTTAPLEGAEPPQQQPTALGPTVQAASVAAGGVPDAKPTRSAPAAETTQVPEDRPPDAEEPGAAPPTLAPEGREADVQVAKTAVAAPFRSRESAMAAIAPAGRPEGEGPFAATLPQVATAIREEMDRIAGAAPHAPADPTMRMPTDGVLRVLKIQLRPAELGLVTVEMRLKDGRLEASLHASRPETADLLRRSASALGDLLSRSGCQADLVILDRPRAQDGPAISAAALPAQAFEGGGRSANDGTRQHRFAREDGRASIPGEDRTDETSIHDDSDRHLYL